MTFIKLFNYFCTCHNMKFPFFLSFFFSFTTVVVPPSLFLYAKHFFSFLRKILPSLIYLTTTLFNSLSEAITSIFTIRSVVIEKVRRENVRVDGKNWFSYGKSFQMEHGAKQSSVFTMKYAIREKKSSNGNKTDFKVKKSHPPHHQKRTVICCDGWYYNNSKSFTFVVFKRISPSRFFFIVCLSPELLHCF